MYSSVSMSVEVLTWPVLLPRNVVLSTFMTVFLDPVACCHTLELVKANLNVLISLLIQEFYNGDLLNCEQSYDKMGRTAQVNLFNFLSFAKFTFSSSRFKYGNYRECT